MLVRYNPQVLKAIDVTFQVLEIARITLLVLLAIAILAVYGLCIAVDRYYDFCDFLVEAGERFREYCDRLVEESLTPPQPQLALAGFVPAGLLMPARDVNLATLTTRELKKLAKQAHIKRWDRLTKAQLIAALL